MSDSNNEELTFDWLNRQIIGFCEDCEIEVHSHTLNDHTIDEVVKRYNRDITYRPGPDIFKRAGYLTFWFRRLKPIHPEATTRRQASQMRHVNEVCAYYLGISMIQSIHPFHMRGASNSQYPDPVKIFREELIYSLRYRPISPHAIGMIYYTAWNLIVTKVRPRTK